MNKIDSISNEIYILVHFKINLFLSGSYIFSKKKTINNKPVPSDVKSYYEFCTFLSLHQLIKVPTRITCNSATIIDHILANYQEKLLNRALFM